MTRLLQRFSITFIVSLLLDVSVSAQQFRVDTLARAPDAQYPVAVAHVPGGGGRFFFTEKSSGNVRLFDRGLRGEPFASVAVEDEGEQGLLGIAIHPAYPAEPYVYVYATRAIDRSAVVVRFRDSSGIGIEPTIVQIIPRLTGGSAGVGGALAFGPDGKLYIGAGDLGSPEDAADSSSRRNLRGKILRVAPDGSTPADAPFAERPFWSFGHHAPAAIAFDPLTGTLYAVEGGTDRRNSVQAIPAGANVNGSAGAPGDRPPPRVLYRFPEGAQPGLMGIVIYRSAAFPRLRGSILVAGHANATIWRGRLPEAGDSLRLSPFFNSIAGYAHLSLDHEGNIVFTNGPYISSRILRLRPVSPAFLSAPPVFAGEYQEYSYTPEFSGTPPGLVLVHGPAGMTIDSSTWSVRWLPDPAQVRSGTASVTLRAENGAGFAEQRFSIRVVNVNDPPGFFAIAETAAVRRVMATDRGVEHVFTWQPSTDPDGDSVTYTLQIDTAATFDSPVRRDSVTRGTSLRVSFPRQGATYFWRVWAGDGRFSVLSVPPRATLAIDLMTPIVAREELPVTEEKTTGEDFPPPINAESGISYTLMRGGHVRLTVFNLLGQEVARLVDGVQGPGRHDVAFAKTGLPGGIYFYRLQAPGILETKKVVVAR